MTIQQELNNSLLGALQNKNYEDAETAIRNGASANTTDQGGNPVLSQFMYNSDAQDINFVKLLLDNGANILTKTFTSFLHYALSQTDQNFVDAILDHIHQNNIDVKPVLQWRDQDHASALDMAVFSGCAETLTKVLEFFDAPEDVGVLTSARQKAQHRMKHDYDKQEATADEIQIMLTLLWTETFLGEHTPELDISGETTGDIT